MAAASNIETLSQAIALLSTVSNKLSTKVISKVSNTAGAEIFVKDASNSIDNAKNDTKAAPKKQKKVVEQPKPVLITEFGRKADDDLAKAFGKKEEKKEKGEKKKEEGGWLKKLLGPGVLGMLGLLGGFVSSLLSGGWGDIIKDFKEGNFKDALGKILDKVYNIFTPLLYRLPIIGPLLALWDAYKAFDAGDGIGGVSKLVQGMIGFLPLPGNLKMAIFGGISVIEQLLKNEFGKETIPKGAGSSIMSIALKAFGKVLNFGVFKKMPIIGSFINFYDAYESFKTASAAGILDGTLSLIAGFANFVPGLGTPISIGLDILRALMFERTKDKEGNIQINTRGWAGKIGDFIMGIAPFSTISKLAEAVGFFSVGDWKTGFSKIGEAFPVLGFFSDLIGGTAAAVATEDSFSGKIKGVGKVIKDAVLTFALRMLPKWLAKKVANYLGVKWEDSGEEEASPDLKTEENKTKKANDFIQTPEQGSVTGINVEGGSTIKPAPDDTIVGFKPEGPIDSMFNKNIQLVTENNSILKGLTESSNKLLSKQIEILMESKNALIQIAKNMESSKSSNSVVSSKNTVTNIFQQSSIRDLQQAYT
jgi:hypothetical protein